MTTSMPRTQERRCVRHHPNWHGASARCPNTFTVLLTPGRKQLFCSGACRVATTRQKQSLDVRLRLAWHASQDAAKGYGRSSSRHGEHRGDGQAGERDAGQESPRPPRPERAFTSRDDAMRFLAEHAGPGSRVTSASDAQAVKRAYRAAALRLHPDRDTGNEELFKLLQAAMRLLR